MLDGADPLLKSLTHAKENEEILPSAVHGWPERWGALTSAPRPAPPCEISAPRPAPPGEISAPCQRTSRASPGWTGLCLRHDPPSPGRPPDLFCPGPTRGLGWHARGSRAGAAGRLGRFGQPSLLPKARPGPPLTQARQGRHHRRLARAAARVPGKATTARAGDRCPGPRPGLA